MNLKETLKRKVEAKINASESNAIQAIKRLEDEGKVSKDFLANLGNTAKNLGKDPGISFTANGAVKMNIADDRFPEPLNLIPHSAMQIAEKFGIPTGYLKSLVQGKDWQKELAARDLNEFSKHTERNRVLVRSVGDDVRGVLSDRYRLMDSKEIVLAFMQEAMNNNARLFDGFMDETRIWIDLLNPELYEINTPKNGLVHMAFGGRISNSDYGDGSLQVRLFEMQAVCTNGLVRESLLRQVHLGKKLPSDFRFSDMTYKLDTQTMASAVKDITQKVFSSEYLSEKAAEIEEASYIEVDAIKELENLKKTNANFLKSDEKAVTEILMSNRQDDGVQGESTLWKFVQGVTAHGRNISAEQPRKSRELQEIASGLMDKVN